MFFQDGHGAVIILGGLAIDSARGKGRVAEQLARLGKIDPQTPDLFLATHKFGGIGGGDGAVAPPEIERCDPVLRCFVGVRNGAASSLGEGVRSGGVGGEQGAGAGEQERETAVACRSGLETGIECGLQAFCARPPWHWHAFRGQGGGGKEQERSKGAHFCQTITAPRLCQRQTLTS